MSSASYPPSPWRLNATAYVSMWRLPVRGLQLSLGERIDAAVLLGSVNLASGFVIYEAGGDLEYRELFLAVLARADGKLGVTVPSIWVDSTRALAGGRELWGIPKQLASFETDGQTLAATANDAPDLPIAKIVFDKGWRVPGRYRSRASVVQQSASTLLRTPVLVSAQIEFGRAQWYIPEASALSLLRGRAPLLSFKLIQAQIQFGA